MAPAQEAERRWHIEAAGEEPEVRLTAARRRVLAVLAGGPPRPAPELAREAGIGPRVVRGLADAGVLEPVVMAPRAMVSICCSRPEIGPAARRRRTKAAVLRVKKTDPLP